MNILFVCTGNTCRSPMAAALMKRRMEREGIPGKAESAGLAASCEPASQLAVTVMREWDIDLRGHHSRPVTAMLCEAADLVAVMSLRHRLAPDGHGGGSAKDCGVGGGIRRDSRSLRRGRPPTTGNAATRWSGRWRQYSRFSDIKKT